VLSFTKLVSSARGLLGTPHCACQSVLTGTRLCRNDTMLKPETPLMQPTGHYPRLNLFSTRISQSGRVSTAQSLTMSCRSRESHPNNRQSRRVRTNSDFQVNRLCRLQYWQHPLGHILAYSKILHLTEFPNQTRHDTRRELFSAGNPQSSGWSSLRACSGTLRSHFLVVQHVSLLWASGRCNVIDVIS
jgi:hypothetical protein